MKHFLLSGLLLAAAGAVSAADSAPARMSLPQSLPARRVVPAVERNVLNLKSLHKASAAKVSRAEAETPSTETVLFESFEAWPIEEENLAWLPEGWTAERKQSVEDLTSWFPFFQAYSYFPAPADGQFYNMIMYSEEEQDEWLISPSVEVQEGMELSYYLFYSPFYLFSSDNFDFDTYEFDGEKVIAATFEVMVKAEDDSEWTLVQDIADRYKDYSGYDLLVASGEMTGMQRQTVSLADYVGKTVQFGFRYVGRDGDMMLLDAIRVGIAQLENVSYSLPANTYYWGYTTGFEGLQADIAQVPVFSPVTFTNTSQEEATYTWEFSDPATGEQVIVDDRIDLELTYQPDYTSAETKANNLHNAPVLVASAPGKASTSYSPSILIQAGGVAAHTIDGIDYEFTLFPFAKNTTGVGGITVSDDKIGDMAIPVFGHSMHTNEYWYNYTAGNDEDANPETCYNHLVAIANLYMPEQGQKLVVNGFNVFGYGLIKPEAELKFSIYGLLQTDGGISTDPSDYKVIATKTITGADIIYNQSEGEQKDYICLPFIFDETAVVTATEEYPAFFFMLEGFNSDAVEYFMPLQAVNPLPDGMNLAYMVSNIDFQVASGRPAYTSVKALVYTEEDDVYHPQTAFAFGMMAEYPWLTCDVESVAIDADNESVNVALGSYYDGSKLTVEASEGLVASAAGRYDECVLTIAREEGTTAPLTGSVTVKAPGVELALGVTVDEFSAITEVAGSSAVSSETYDLFGRRAAKGAKGLHVVKFSDGSVRKQVIRD